MGWVKDVIAECENLKKENKKEEWCHLCRRPVDLSDKWQKEVHEEGKRHTKNVQFSRVGL